MVKRLMTTATTTMKKTRKTDTAKGFLHHAPGGSPKRRHEWDCVHTDAFGGSVILEFNSVKIVDFKCLCWPVGLAGCLVWRSERIDK